jgi:hypothetical protein
MISSGVLQPAHFKLRGQPEAMAGVSQYGTGFANVREPLQMAATVMLHAIITIGWKKISTFWLSWVYLLTGFQSPGREFSRMVKEIGTSKASYFMIA